MLDIIITISKDTPTEWVDQCYESCTDAAFLAGYPVGVILAKGVPGHIGRAMAGGLARATAPYVAWVDDDDYVVADAFSCLHAALLQGPAAVFARETSLLANGRLIKNNERHHLNVYQRDAILDVDLEQYPAIPNVALYRATEKLPVIDVMEWIYVRRRRMSGGMRLRATMTELERSIL